MFVQLLSTVTNKCERYTEKLVRRRREDTVLLLAYLTSYLRRLLIDTFNQGHKGDFVGPPQIKYDVITRRIAIERRVCLIYRARLFRGKLVNYVEQPRFIRGAPIQGIPVRSEIRGKIFQIPSTTEIDRILEISGSTRHGSFLSTFIGNILSPSSPLLSMEKIENPALSTATSRLHPTSRRASGTDPRARRLTLYRDPNSHVSQPKENSSSRFYSDHVARYGCRMRTRTFWSISSSDSFSLLFHPFLPRRRAR